MVPPASITHNIWGQDWLNYRWEGQGDRKVGQVKKEVWQSVVSGL